MNEVKSTKTPNYTSEQTREVLALWDDGKTTAEIADLVGRTVKSIVAKISRETKAEGYARRIYQAKTYKTKAGDTVSRKAELAGAIGAVLALSANDTESLTSATKIALQAIFAALANSKPISE